ncbi:MAG: hypothetical protein JWM20_753 [Patescibacteria group bacterium]|nr:hypothetical protein [Patescibacteria group bacterium]
MKKLVNYSSKNEVRRAVAALRRMLDDDLYYKWYVKLFSELFSRLVRLKLGETFSSNEIATEKSAKFDKKRIEQVEVLEFILTEASEKFKKEFGEDSPIYLEGESLKTYATSDFVKIAKALTKDNKLRLISFLEMVRDGAKSMNSKTKLEDDSCFIGPL